MNVGSLEDDKEPGTWSMNKGTGLYLCNSTTSYYSEDDWHLFTQKVCIPLCLDSLEKFIEICKYRTYDIRRYIEAISKKETPASVYLTGEITNSSAEYHAQLLHYLFIIPLEELPLLINEKDPDLLPVIKWRLSIGK